MFSSHNRQGSLRWLAALILGACAVVGVIRADASAPSSVQAQNPAGYTFYLLMFQGFSPKPKGEEWAIYVSHTGGYSFRYPANGVIEELNNGHATVELWLPTGWGEKRITVGYLTFEKPEDEDLHTWAHDYFSIYPGARLLERDFGPADLDVKAPGDESQQLYFQSTPEVLERGYLITHGSLVLMVNISASEESLFEIFEALADSITFVPHAPMNLEQLYDASPSLSILPDSPLSHANQATSPLAPPATPIPAHLQGLVQYRAFSVYGETFPRFEVWYDPETWEPHEQYNGLDGVLVHWHLVGCELWLPAGAGGAERIARVQLAGREWGIFELGPTMLAYSTRYETIAFTFVVMLPEDYSLDAKSPCQEAAEAVIDTFSIQPEKSMATRKEITQEIAIYHGVSTYHNYAFEIHYNPETWEYIERDHVFGDLLRHRHVPYCIMSWDTGSLPFHTLFRGTLHIAKRDWAVYTFHTNIYTTTGQFSLYSLHEAESYFAFEAIMSDEVSLEDSSLCQREIEEVIDTFKLETEVVWEENDASTSTPTMADSPLSHADQATSPLAPPAAPVPAHPQGFMHYRGDNPYGEEYPQFGIWYDPELWEYHAGYGSHHHVLVHHHIPDCRLDLQTGPRGAERIARVQLADREWGIFEHRPAILTYSTLYEDHGFLFHVILPEDYSLDAKSPCQEAAEAVIDTFSVVFNAK